MVLTNLELTVLGYVARGQDPWSGSIRHAGVVSQAIQRLRRKGAVRGGMGGRFSYCATDAGKAYLAGEEPSPAA